MNRKHSFLVAAAACAVAVLSLSACSGSGTSSTPTVTSSTSTGTSGGSAAKAGTKKYQFAMITHAQPGDTFWSIIRNGANAAAKTDNVSYTYSANPQAPQQAQLIQAAIDKHVDGIAVTDPNPAVIGPEIKKAAAAGIPVVMFNSGESNAIQLGALGYFGEDEVTAGEAGGARIAKAGAKNVLCVDQAAGQQQLLNRCEGVKKGLASEGTMTILYVNGTESAQVTTAIQAKLTQDPSIDWVITLGAPDALDAIKSIQGANSKAKLSTFDTSGPEVQAIKSGQIQWAIDQQPYLQGYLAINALWLYVTNGDTIGGGSPTATGPAFIDSSNVAAVAAYAARGTR